MRDEAAFYMKYIKDVNSPDLDSVAGFARVILQKILPRLQGSSFQVKEVLEDILGQYESSSRELSFNDDDYTPKMQNLIKGASPLVKKLGNMLIQFREDGFTSFWAN